MDKALFLVIAVLLVALSYQFEQIAYENILPAIMFFGVPISILTAIAFNAAKLSMAWIAVRGTTTSRLGATTAKLVYIMLSLLASLMVVSFHADAPNLEQAVRDQKFEITQAFAARIREVQAVETSQSQTIRERLQHQRDDIMNRYQKVLDQLEVDRKAEMLNTDSSGNFLGKRYREIMRQIALKTTERDQRIDALNDKEQQSLSALQAKLQTQINTLQQKRDIEMAKVSRESLRSDDRAMAPYLVAPVRLVNSIMGSDLTVMHLALLITLIMTAGIEFSPLVLIGHLARDSSSATPKDVAASQSIPAETGSGAQNDSPNASHATASEHKVLPLNSKRTRVQHP